MLYLACKSEVKADDKGQFSGYANIKGNIDQGGDMVVDGAYREFTRMSDGRMLVLYQHSAREPIGKAQVQEDSRGLHVEGDLMLDDPTACRVYGHLKNGLAEGMSIGYELLDGGATYKGTHRELSAIRVHEVSIVTFPMNRSARVETVKSAMECADVRELEQLLRENLSLSRRKAAAGAGLLWPVLRERDAHAGDREDREADAEALGGLLVAELKSLNEFLTKET